MRVFRVLSLAALFATPFAAAPSLAADQPASPQRTLLQPPVVEIPSPITDRFAIRVVYFRPSVSTTARYDDAAGNPGTTFSGEDLLGLPATRNQGWIDLMFRMTDRHRIEAQFYQLKRGGEAVFAQPLRFGNDTFGPGDGEIHSRMDLRQLNLAYTYSLVRQPQLELGLGFGIHLVQLEGSLEAPATFKREHLDTAGPYPTLGGQACWRFTRRFSASAAAQVLAFSSHGVDGTSVLWNADVQFRARPNLAVGLGYADTRYRLDSTDADFFPGYLRLRYRGPEFFLRASF
ncbi:MAG TPA: hypothetical protein VMH77_07775 [Steroidobacteraceae bacterium]|nr:hypothetical protein [Steroidobacteraceae bacterium]